MSLILVVVFVMCMFIWLLAALPVQQVAPWGWVHPLVAWIAVAILGYVVLSGGAHRLSSLSLWFS